MLNKLAIALAAIGIVTSFAAADASAAPYQAAVDTVAAAAGYPLYGFGYDAAAPHYHGGPKSAY
jgi:hypothetical protein